MKHPNDLGIKTFRHAATDNIGEFIDSVPVFLSGLWCLLCFIAMPILWPIAYAGCLLIERRKCCEGYASLFALAAVSMALFVGAVSFFYLIGWLK